MRSWKVPIMVATLTLLVPHLTLAGQEARPPSGDAAGDAHTLCPDPVPDPTPEPDPDPVPEPTTGTFAGRVLTRRPGLTWGPLPELPAGQGQIDTPAEIGDQPAFAGVAIVTRRPRNVMLAPVAGARVTVMPRRPIPIFRGRSTRPTPAMPTVVPSPLVATTDQAGRFNIDGLAPGAYSFTVTHADYRTESGAFEIRDELPSVFRDIYLVPTFKGAFGGRVLSECDSTHQHPNEDSHAVAGALVELTSGERKYNSRSDAQGWFRFQDLPEGAYSYAVSHVGYANGQGEFSLSEASREITREIRLPREAVDGRFKGRVVTYQRDSWGITTTAARLPKKPVVPRPVPDQLILITGDLNYISITATTDHSGSFDVSGLPAGSYRYEVANESAGNASGSFEITATAPVVERVIVLSGDEPPQPILSGAQGATTVSGSAENPFAP